MFLFRAKMENLPVARMLERPYTVMMSNMPNSLRKTQHSSEFGMFETLQRELTDVKAQFKECEKKTIKVSLVSVSYYIYVYSNNQFFLSFFFLNANMYNNYIYHIYIYI